MSQAFTDWKEAHGAAVDLARLLKRETGIEKACRLDAWWRLLHLCGWDQLASRRNR